MSMLVIIIMGSPSDDPLGQQIIRALEEFDIPWEMRIASAHKTPGYLLDLLEKYEADPRPKVYITVAGRSNALSGMVDAQVSAPVIACPPYSDKYAGGDLFSSLRAPSGVAPAVVLEPKNAVLLAAKILGLSDPDLCDKVRQAQEKQRQRLCDVDTALKE
ncbi:MAG: AIR carboxylase family protein [Chloroflexi bacterium]|nr:AIR carboxylase family protein [Chloroflexota bacterium]